MLTINKIFININILLDGYFSKKYKLIFIYDNISGFVDSIPDLYKYQLDLPLISKYVGVSFLQIHSDLINKLNLIEMELSMHAYALERGKESTLNINEIDIILSDIQEICREILIKLKLYSSKYDTDEN